MPYIGKSPSAGVRQRYQYTATAGQTTFSGTDLGNLTLTYTDNNFVDVFQNGVLLKGGGTDYTATSGTSVVLATGASVSDVIEIIVYDVFSVGNFFNRTDSDSRYALTERATTWNIGSAYNTNFTASAGNGYFVSTSSGAVTATLPASPSAGDTVRFIDLSATFDSNNLTVGRNSEKIMGDAADLTVATERAGFGLVYSDSTNGWLLIDK